MGTLASAFLAGGLLYPCISSLLEPLRPAIYYALLLPLHTPDGWAAQHARQRVPCHWRWHSHCILLWCANLPSSLKLRPAIATKKLRPPHPPLGTLVPLRPPLPTTTHPDRAPRCLHASSIVYFTQPPLHLTLSLPVSPSAQPFSAPTPATESAIAITLPSSLTPMER